MTDPVVFPSSTVNTQLPLLFSGQAQKEFFINEALSIIDAIAPSVVNAVQAEAPTQHSEGVCYLVDDSPTGEWTDHQAQIACSIGGGWHFVEPVEGMELFDQATGQKLVYASGWSRAVTPDEPSGGATIDHEARTAVVELIAALKVAGVLPIS